jgi:hypothetical protein
MTIGNFCFSDCSFLEDVILSESVRALGSNCFDNCKNLKSIVFPQSFSQIGNHCFFRCSFLHNCGFTNTARSSKFKTEIGDFCIAGCSFLEFIINFDLIQSFGSHCFDNCKNLKFLIQLLNLVNFVFIDACISTQSSFTDQYNFCQIDTFPIVINLNLLKWPIQ